MFAISEPYSAFPPFENEPKGGISCSVPGCTMKASAPAKGQYASTISSVPDQDIAAVPAKVSKKASPSVVATADKSKKEKESKAAKDAKDDIWGTLL